MKLKHNGRSNRRARKLARAISSPAPGGGKTTFVFSRRHDKQRPGLRQAAYDMGRWLKAISEMDNRHAIYRRGQLSQGAIESRRMLVDDLGDAARRYMDLLHVGMPLIQNGRPIPTRTELDDLATALRAQARYDRDRARGL